MTNVMPNYPYFLSCVTTLVYGRFHHIYGSLSSTRPHNSTQDIHTNKYTQPFRAFKEIERIEPSNIYIYIYICIY